MSRTHRLDHIERTKIILFSSALKQDKDIAHELGIASRTVRKWVTSNLIQRIYQHKESLADGFTKKYNIHKLVYYEVHLDVKEAILREKRIKKWNRQWKINLIEQHNPQWLDFRIGLC